MNVKCTYCNNIFKNVLNMNNHQKNSKYCKKYKNVIFFCKKCDFCTEGIKEIENHMLICNEDLKNKININNKINILEQKIDELTLYTKNLENIINTEIIKNNVYKQILNNNLGLFNSNNETINNVSEEVNNNVSEETINNVSEETINNVSEEVNNNVSEETINNVSEETINNVSEETINNVSEEVSNNVSEEVKNNVSEEVKNNVSEEVKNNVSEEVKNNVSEEVKNNVSEEVSNTLFDIFENHFEKILEVKLKKDIVKILKTIKKIRYKSIKTTNINEYVQIVGEHIKRIKTILKNKRVKGKDIINDVFYPIELRIVCYNNIKDNYIHIDDIEKLKVCLKYSSNFKNNIYNIDDICNTCLNYGLSLMSIKESLKIFLNCNNSIKYFNLSNNDNHYSFYQLEKIKGNRKYWKMDCRLENFTSVLSSNLLKYCIDLFRQLYQNIFNDNIYREDFISYSQIAEYECNQLIHNIFILCNYYKFNNIVKNFFIEKHTYEKTEKDILNLQSDDLLQLKQSKFMSENIEDIYNYIKLMFDNIDEKQSKQFYNNYKL